MFSKEDVVRYFRPHGLSYPLIRHYTYNVEGLDKRLHFVGAQHVADSPTKDLVKHVLDTEPVNVIIVEGLVGDEPKSPWFKEKAQQEKEKGFTSHGSECAFAVCCAHEKKIDVIGGEISDDVLHEQLLAKNYDTDDYIGFYILREFIHKKNPVDDIKAQIDSIIKTPGLFTSKFREQHAPITCDRFYSWFTRVNNTTKQIQDLEIKDLEPIADDNHYFKTMADHVSHIRNEYLLGKINELLTDVKNNNVLVVYGAAHLVCLHPALNKSAQSTLDVMPEQIQQVVSVSCLGSSAAAAVGTNG